MEKIYGTQLLPCSVSEQPKTKDFQKDMRLKPLNT